MSHSVGEVAGFAGVTVRTLHHYDEIGLLVPGGRTHAGHRRYTDADLDRLQRILFYRELGFPLDEVAVLLDDPDADPRAHLRRQHTLLTARIEKLRRMAEAVEHAMEARRMGIDLTPEERFEVFGDNDPEQYAEEAEARWGGTEKWAESQRRAAGYGKEDWKRLRAEADDWSGRYARLVAAGEPATGEAARALAEEHRQHIGRWFYDCPHTMHRCLAGMYVADERFKAFYDALHPGLAEHLHDAILANADRHIS
ncbi:MULTISPECIES: MerR family transcriptional regulator [unclassified Streptomyces]|uniref:MerR family transcriptional regulator n=1 Tax=unclassified Streptomyces TaxID=2593676 RepID=UPI001317A62A|nr:MULTISPECIES: MerR family transcriptional regulator [unclassified Streptomyces]QHC30645.1 MerR family transcriptional regulator [Streptomyces sp. HF10]WKE70445.1 MerR family transcriptional regulator [Streptomyces sp. WP-1]